MFVEQRDLLTSNVLDELMKGAKIKVNDDLIIGYGIDLDVDNQPIHIPTQGKNDYWKLEQDSFIANFKVPGATKEVISVKVKENSFEVSLTEDILFERKGLIAEYLLPRNCKRASLTASVENGVLTVSVKKKHLDFTVEVQ